MGVCLYPARSTTALQTAWTLAILGVLSTTNEHYSRLESTTKGKAESGTSSVNLLRQKHYGGQESTLEVRKRKAEMGKNAKKSSLRSLCSFAAMRSLKPLFANCAGVNKKGAGAVTRCQSNKDKGFMRSDR
jgi:hypothetical protein